MIAMTARAAKIDFFMELSFVSPAVLADGRRLPRIEAPRSEVLHTPRALIIQCRPGTAQWLGARRPAILPFVDERPHTFLPIYRINHMRKGWIEDAWQRPIS